MAIGLGLDHTDCDHVVIYTDSQYSLNALSYWWKGWIKNNWTDTQGQPIKNRPLIESILAKIKLKKSVRFVKVKAHTGNKYNTVVDYLATDLTKRMTFDPSVVTGEYPIPV